MQITEFSRCPDQPVTDKFFYNIKLQLSDTKFGAKVKLDP